MNEGDSFKGFENIEEDLQKYREKTFQPIRDENQKSDNKKNLPEASKYNIIFDISKNPQFNLTDGYKILHRRLKTSGWKVST